MAKYKVTLARSEHGPSARERVEVEADEFEPSGEFVYFIHKSSTKIDGGYIVEKEKVAAFQTRHVVSIIKG